MYTTFAIMWAKNPGFIHCEIHKVKFDNACQLVHLILGGHVLFEAVTNLYLSVVIGIIVYNGKVINDELGKKSLMIKRKFYL